MDVLTSLLGRSGYLPHGVCFTWTPGLLWTMVGADALIASAYFSIPMAIFAFLRQRNVIQLRWVAWLFCAFIFACGITHVMDVWTIWQPDYAVQALTKVVTAATSVVTAVALWRLIPQALRIPSVDELQATIRALEAEAARRRNAEQTLAVAMASIGAGFIVTTRDGVVARMNGVAERFTGWPQGEAVGRSLWQVFQREGRLPEHERMNPVDRVLSLNTSVDTPHHVTVIARDGARTAIEVKAATIEGPDEGLGGLVLVLRDRTRELLAEAESNRLAAIVESSFDAIISKTLDGRITSWNAAAQTMFGYGADEAIGQPVAMLVPDHLIDEEMRIIANLSNGVRVLPFDTVRVAKDGRPLDVSVTISPIRDASGRVVGASKIARDVSLQREAAAALRDSESRRIKARQLEAENAQILQASRLKSQFLANMSHELRTPLNAVIGFAELLHSGAVAADNPRHHAFLGHISTSGRHLLQLINDVLDLSKVEAGKFEFFPEPVQLPSLVREVCDVLTAQTSRKRIAISTELDPSLTDLVLDPARLKQVLYNYLSNAIKFTPEGGRVTVRALAQGAWRFRIEVEDTGIGIPDADLARLFIEFQQLDAGASKQHQGTGLGLALTRRLVQTQGGSVGVRSVVGEGSVFHLVLPRRHVPTAALPAPLRRLLLIEHDANGGAPAVRALTEAGFDVDHASTAEQALALARAQAYDAITLDLLLPDQRGLDLLARIREHGPSREVPVVGVTMAAPVPAESGAGVEGMASFAVADVLGKPLRSEEIVAAMARFAGAGPQRARVAVIDDDPLALELMRNALGTIGIDAVCFADARQGLAAIEAQAPDALILDLMMPGFDGFAVLDTLQRMPARRDTPVFIWTSMLLTDEEYASLARSAEAVVGKGGGSFASMLDTLRRWRPPLPAVEVQK